MLGGGDRVAEWRIHDHDAAGSGASDIDVVDPYAGPADHFEAGGGGNDLLVCLGRGPHREAIVATDAAHEFRLREPDSHFNLHSATAKDLESFWAQFIGNENFGHEIPYRL